MPLEPYWISLLSDWHCPQVAKLRKERDAKEEELEVFIKVSPAQLWDNDLEEFLRAWRVCPDVDDFTRSPYSYQYYSLPECT